MTKKISMGKQKVKMMKIPDKKNLHVTFSKRRSGLFKKASELTTLCGAKVAILVISPGKNVFSFGHPHVESVVDRFVNGSPPSTSNTLQVSEDHCNTDVQKLNMELTQVLDHLEDEKKRGEELTKMMIDSQRQNWWQAPIDELNFSQLEQLKVSLEGLKQRVVDDAKKILKSSTPSPQFFPGCSSIGGETELTFAPTNMGFNPNMPNVIHHYPPPPPPAPPAPHPHQEYNPKFGF